LKTLKHSKSARRSATAQACELTGLRTRLADAQETLRAIHTGDVDTVAVTGKKGLQVFTLAGAEQAYRELIESMNEGALTLTADATILYANKCFARMVRCPLEQVVGGSLRRYLSATDGTALRALLLRAAKFGAKIQVVLRAADGSQMPAHVSIRPLGGEGAKNATAGMVVTDMTEARRSEEVLRNLTHRLMQAQEAERGRVALELHDHITQLLCAVLARSQALVDKLSGRGGPLRSEAVKLREMLGETAVIVERISRNLRPSVLDHLGLVAALRDASTEFGEQTGLAVEVRCEELPVRLPAGTELTLYRILQEALENVKQHGRAKHVMVSLSQQGDSVELVVKDDGIGFDVARNPSRRQGKQGLGLLSMRERATYVGGMLNIKSVPGKGTTIRVQTPLIELAAGRNSWATKRAH
jgi:two-component system NarL family sensor kinase